MTIDYQERLQRQRCKSCWNADGFDFYVPDEVWKSIVPVSLQNHVVCLQRFDDFAYELGIDYYLEKIYFSGNQMTFLLLNTPDESSSLAEQTDDAGSRRQLHPAT